MQMCILLYYWANKMMMMIPRYEATQKLHKMLSSRLISHADVELLLRRRILSPVFRRNR